MEMCEEEEEEQEQRNLIHIDEDGSIHAIFFALAGWLNKLATGIFCYYYYYYWASKYSGKYDISVRYTLL